MTKNLYTAATAIFIGVAQNTVYKWAARGDFSMNRNLDKFSKNTATPVGLPTRKKSR